MSQNYSAKCFKNFFTQTFPKLKQMNGVWNCIKRYMYDSYGTRSLEMCCCENF